LFFCSGDGGEDGDSNAGDQEAVNNFLSCFFCSGDGGEDGDSNAGDQEAPEPSELIEALQELENSASSDAVVRYGMSRESLLPGNTCKMQQGKIVLTADWVS
jgi:hypothetical protein